GRYNHTCVACLKEKQHKASCKTKLVNSVSKPLHTLHMDLFGPTFVSSLNHKWYCFVVTDDFSRCDNGGEFKNKEMNEFCTKKRIKREFSSGWTPQQNRVAERRNRTLIKATRSMLADAKLPVTIWAEAVNTACYVQNRVLVYKSQNKTPYELFNSRTHAIGFLRPFGCHVMILNTLDHLGKFDAKGDEENKLIEKGAGPNWLFDIDTLTNSMNYVPVVVTGTSSTNISGTKDVASQAVKKDVSSLRYIALLNWFHEAHMKSSNSDAQDACNADALESNGISNPSATLKNPPAEQMESLTVESKSPIVSSPVPTVFLDTSPETSSGSRLISKGVFSQEETPSLDNALTLSNRFEDTIRVEADLSNMESSIPASPTLTFRIHKDHPKSQIISPEEPKKIFDALKDPSWVLKNKKDERGIMIRNKARLAVQGHTQEEGIDYKEVFAPLARIEAIRLFLAYASFMGFTVYQMDVKSAFLYGTIDEEGNNGSGKDVELHLYRSMIRSFMYLNASRLDIMFAVRACARHQVTPKECHLHAIKRIFRYLKGHPKLGLWYPKESPFDLVAYSDSDYGGATQDRKSTTEEYVAAASGCGKVLWIQNQMLDYGYALTISPTVYVSHIRQFWSTARIETTNEETKILATVDGKPRTISESLLRRHLKLKDEEGISYLPDTELFENLSLMGYNILQNQRFTFQKGQFSHQWKFFIHTIMQCLSPKSTGFNEFSSNIATAMGECSTIPTEPHHTPSSQEQHSPHHDPSSPSHPTTTTDLIPLTPTESLTKTPTLRQYSRGATRIVQSKALSPAADERASLLRDDSQGKAFPTVSSLDAGQNRENITKTSALPHESSLRVTSLDADEGSMQQKLQELIDLCTGLQRQQTQMVAKIQAQDLEISGLKARVKLFEDKDRGSAEPSQEDAPIIGGMVNVLNTMEAANILTSGVAAVSVSPVAAATTVGVPTVSGIFPTFTAIFTTASVLTPYLRRPREISAKDKGKEKVVESEVPKKRKLQEQIDAQVTREIEEEFVRDNHRNEMIAKHLQEYEQAVAELSIGEKIELINELVKYQDHHAKILKYQAQQIKPLSKKEQRDFYMSVLRSHAGWKTRHFKGMTLKEIKEKFIPMKTSEDVSEEDLKGMMQLVPFEEVYVEALQVKHPIIDWEIHSEGQREYWKIIRLGAVDPGEGNPNYQTSYKRQREGVMGRAEETV
nr:hypothetical protein [Tanacetum cinerariifolium]GEX41888.1 hypothetical protein [Tanacetum cinerariifolium]